jgi:hypothetical protein
MLASIATSIVATLRNAQNRSGRRSRNERCKAPEVLDDGGENKLVAEARSVGKGDDGNCHYVGFVPANLPVSRERLDASHDDLGNGDEAASCRRYADRMQNV